MKKIAVKCRFDTFLFNAASFAAEKTVTLAVENMTCTACPAHREGESRGGSRRQQCGHLFRGQDRDGHL